MFCHDRRGKLILIILRYSIFKLNIDLVNLGKSERKVTVLRKKRETLPETQQTSSFTMTHSNLYYLQFRRKKPTPSVNYDTPIPKEISFHCTRRVIRRVPSKLDTECPVKRRHKGS